AGLEREGDWRKWKTPRPGRAWEGSQTAADSGRVMPLRGRRMWADKRHRFVEGNRFAVVRRRRGRQRVLHFLQRDLQGLARDLALAALRPGPRQAILPRQVTVPQLAGVAFQRRQ